MKKIKKALISVSDKSNLESILKLLKKYNIKTISSGGTYKEIKKLGYNCLEVSEYTGSPEILDGRVKTLHPKIHGGILSNRKKKSHIKDLRKNNFEEIDLVIVNFYPFEKTLNSTKNDKKIIENIDIGGPTMVRSAAKNYNDVVVITSSKQYGELIYELNKNKGSTSLNFREKSFIHLFDYVQVLRVPASPSSSIYPADACPEAVHRPASSPPAPVHPIRASPAPLSSPAACPVPRPPPSPVQPARLAPSSPRSAAVPPPSATPLPRHESTRIRALVARVAHPHRSPSSAATYGAPPRPRRLNSCVDQTP